MLLILGVLVLLLVLWYFDCFGRPVETYMYVLPAKMPVALRPSLFVTYTSYDRVPAKVWDGLDRFANEYTLRFFDDAACEAYLGAHFHPDVLARYRRITRGAHRADLWRYCVLYREGGLYLDIKTHLLRPVSTFIPRTHNVTVLSKVQNTVYQGILSMPSPGNALLARCIAHIMKTPQRLLDTPVFTNWSGYLLLTRIMYTFIRQQLDVERLVPGDNGEWFLLEERCDPDCIDPDRYGMCCHIFSSDQLVANTRYTDFPWTTVLSTQ
jgi:hypothetical protein